MHKHLINVVDIAFTYERALIVWLLSSVIFEGNLLTHITHSLMKDGVPSEKSEVGIKFVFGSTVKSKS